MLYHKKMKQNKRPSLLGKKACGYARCCKASAGYLVNLPFKMPKNKIKLTVEFANRADPDEAAHNEPPHLALLCLCYSILNMV